MSTVFSILPQYADSDSNDELKLALTERAFMAGMENAALLVATDSLSTKRHYNPLLLYGPAGVGKTHLLQVLTEEFARRNRTRQVLYCTGADYCRTLAAAIELDSLPDVRDKHRNLDLLAIDDLQALADKRTAQQELLFTLDERIQNDRLVLIASRSTPSELDHLLPGLRSRLCSGLALPVAKPGTETRAAILDELAQKHQLALTDDAKQLLVKPSKRAVRKLETFGQLNSAVLELAQITRQPITAHDVRALITKPAEGLEFSLRQITRVTARHFQLRVADLVGASRRQSIVQARGIAMYLARRLLGSSFEELGQHFGGRDHSTVMHSFRKIEDGVVTDPAIQQAVQDITRRLGVP